MEIERKFLIDEKAFDFSSYPHKELEQAYLCTSPVVRVRREDDNYILTYKGSGMMAREEYNLPLNKQAYEHLLAKHDGRIISKTRYLIPLEPYTVELDVFHGELAPLVMAEVEFPSLEAANSFIMPSWFIEDVTSNPAYHNSNMSKG